MVLYDEMGGDASASPPQQELEHFLEALVVISDGTRHGTIPAFKLVDGQQRLTSVFLLCGLARVARGLVALARRARKLLVNAYEEGDLYFKLLATTKYGDHAAYIALLRGEEQPSPCASRIPQAFEYFHGEVRSRVAASRLDLNRLFQVLNHFFHVVFIDLNRAESPYHIFDSPNGNGRRLSQADLAESFGSGIRRRQPNGYAMIPDRGIHYGNSLVGN